MPKVSEFYGIKIFIYWEDQGQHSHPHFHAFYGDYEATFMLDGAHIVGKMPKTAKKLIRSWALENRELIEYAWNQAVMKKPLPAIRGLK